VSADLGVNDSRLRLPPVKTKPSSARAAQRVGVHLLKNSGTCWTFMEMHGGRLWEKTRTVGEIRSRHTSLHFSPSKMHLGVYMSLFQCFVQPLLLLTTLLSHLPAYGVVSDLSR